jgi:hypothetical protein
VTLASLQDNLSDPLELRLSVGNFLFVDFTPSLIDQPVHLGDVVRNLLLPELLHEDLLRPFGICGGVEARHQLPGQAFLAPLRP